MSDKGSSLTIDDFSEVSEALWDARHKWFNIGVRFGVKVTELEVIRKEYDAEERFQRMIITWLNAGKNCNWERVCEALSHPTVGMQHMAMKLKDSQEDRSQTAQDTQKEPEQNAKAQPQPSAITAQMEATTLTQAQYNTIAALMCSLLHLPTEALVYDGHIHRPLTHYFHCAAEELGRDGLFAAMARVGMCNISISIPQIREMALFESAWDGGVKSVIHALESGACVDVTRPDGCSPLILSAQNGHINVVYMLLQYGATVDKPDMDAEAALATKTCGRMWCGH